MYMGHVWVLRGRRGLGCNQVVRAQERQVALGSSELFFVMRCCSTKKFSNYTEFILHGVVILHGDAIDKYLAAY